MLRISVLGVFALGAAAAAAQTPPPQKPPVSRASFIATMDGEFRKLDANRDGAATRAELEASQQRIFVVSATRAAQAQFQRIDTDRNGQISPTEFVRAAAARPQKIDVTKQMGRLDTNRDAKVTLVEYRTLTLANFDRLDADKDGLVSQAELKAGGIR